jgi:CRP-like cAMP-binding protein
MIQLDSRSRYGKVWPGNCPAILAGDMGDTFFMIYEGQALLVVRDDQGEDMILGSWVAHHWPKITTFELAGASLWRS